MSRLRTILYNNHHRDFAIRVIGWLFLLSVSLSAVDRPARADDGVEFFERKIRPLLIKHCYKCHSAAATEVKGGLRLDSRPAIRKGGETGPAVVPRKIDDSLLIDALRHETFEMPPDKKLSEAVIADFEHWIKLGAPDPRDKPPTAREAAELSWQTTLAERRTWWSLQPVGTPPVPQVKNSHWSDRVIDRFILAKLEEAGLTPADQADARTLIRRLSLVLIGLPPSPGEVEGFLAEYAAQPEAAYDDLVDRLLDSPHFGERWARHWMDVVRFTDTHGSEWNYEVHHAWRYRDYLIRALNQDVPYDQFVREHIAGDLLPQPRWNQQQQFNESLIGTAFYRFGEVNHDDCIGLRKIGFDIVDNQIDTLTKAFQATTVACSRCHDHKIDAVSTRDYYALLGILRSSRLVAHTIDSPAVNAQPMRQLSELKVKIRREIAGLWLHDAANIGRYLMVAEAVRHKRTPGKQAAGLDAQRLEKWVAALKIKQPPIDHPLSPWLSLIDMVADTDSAAGDNSGLAAAWKKLASRYRGEYRARTKFNDEHFVPFGDFRNGRFDKWSTSGHGLRDGTVNSGSFCIVATGDAVVNAILPAGCFTHTLSQKLNGTLRSPVLHKGKKHISFQVMGEHTSAVRLVSNNCQLNYKNYRALTSEKLGWVTVSPPVELDSIRVYVELMTKFDNPKFPDQLGTLGGDKQNDRIPWEKAAADPRSYFGITRVVRHDCSETPKPQLDHLTDLFENQPAVVPLTLAAAAKRYSLVIERAIRAWGKNQATDADARWLDWLVKSDLLDNSQRQTPQLAQLVAEYRAVEQHKLALPRIVPGVADFDVGFDQAVLLGGDCMKPGEIVPRRYLEVLARPGVKFTPAGSGRLALAERIASAQNPLTARVMANRIWHHLFGTGIVKSVDDFGRIGELPSHPELLDHLAGRFVEQSWSIKNLIRRIVQSETFRMSNRVTPVGKEIDPHNRLLHHFPARRMDAEAIRDSILFTSGRLDRKMYGLSISPYREQPNNDRRLFPGPLDGHGRRSVYTKVRLMEGAKFLGAFNFPGSKVTQGRRDVTNVPSQALALLNDPFVSEQSGVWAKRLVEPPQDSVASKIERMFLEALGRPPSADERREFQQLARRFAELYQVQPANILTERVIWQDFAHVMFNLKEFIYIP